MSKEPVKVAVFDLNQTVYNHSSKEEFFKYICYKRNYKLLDIFQLTVYKLLGKLRLLNQTQFKENFFNYLDDIPPHKVEEYAAEFWNIEYHKHFNQELLHRIEELKSEGTKIIFISGALEIYIKPLFKNHLEVDQCMGTKAAYEGDTYKVKGEACKDKEKTRRLKEYMADKEFTLVETYSDEEEDLFKLAQKAFLVEDGKVIPYQQNKAE